MAFALFLNGPTAAFATTTQSSEIGLPSRAHAMRQALDALQAHQERRSAAIHAAVQMARLSLPAGAEQAPTMIAQAPQSEASAPTASDGPTAWSGLIPFDPESRLFQLAAIGPNSTGPPEPLTLPKAQEPLAVKDDRGKTGLLDGVNRAISPLQITGLVRSTVGFTGDDFILQKANGDLNERNFRVLFGNARYNTFDPRVFSRTRINLDTPPENVWQLHSNITVDPWSFVGKTNKVTVVGDTPTDSLEVQLKWWSGTNTAINETFYTTKNGDSAATPEIETNEGRTVPTVVTSAFSNTFRIPALEVDYSFQPVRWFWTGYKTETVDFRLFPLALEDQVVGSDDPLGLSNHHIYWEPSPWLDQWLPGRVNTGATPQDFTRGNWSDDLSFFTRDSDLTRLTALRGSTLQWQPTEETTVQAAMASPKTLWQDYGRFDSFLGMTRVKQMLLNDRASVGGIYTARWGYRNGDRDATNNVFGLDASLTPWDWLTWQGEAATSASSLDRTTSYNSTLRGWALHNAVSTRFFDERLTGRFYYTHMDEGFDPGLANYRNTRDDRFWGRHLRFKRKPSLWRTISPVSPIQWQDVAATRIGDGIDVGRDAVGARINGSLFDGRLEPLLDVRNVHRTNGKYLETVVRQENTARALEWLTTKTLFIYHDLPDTVAGIDPFVVNSDDDQPFLNTAVPNDRSPSLLTFSLGAEVSPSPIWSIWGVWERTNDTTLSTGNYPRGLLNNSSFATFNDGGQVIRRVSPFLYSQGFFPQAPYPYFNIFRAGVYVEPTEEVEVSLDWTRNEFEHAGQIDDNLNHVGVMAAWAPVKNLVIAGRYVASWAIDVTRENASEGAKLRDHHSLYGRVTWKPTDRSQLSLEFGEAALGPSTLFTIDPYGDYYPTLDTEHLVRIIYTAEF